LISVRSESCIAVTTLAAIGEIAELPPVEDVPPDAAPPSLPELLQPTSPDRTSTRATDAPVWALKERSVDTGFSFFLECDSE
jgi:hypothetical protein